jgi:hypothetical protein
MAMERKGVKLLSDFKKAVDVHYCNLYKYAKCPNFTDVEKSKWGMKEKEYELLNYILELEQEYED